MNLKEEIDRKMWHGSNIIHDDRYFLPVDDAVSIAESYAKEKAWGAWVAIAMQDSANDLSKEPMIFNDWWEKNKQV